MSGAEQQLMELNQRRETWCRVEGNSGCCSWDRAERRHYRRHLRTGEVLLTAVTAAARPPPLLLQPREACTQRPPPLKRPERRHYEESYESHLV